MNHQLIFEDKEVIFDIDKRQKDFRFPKALLPLGEFLISFTLEAVGNPTRLDITSIYKDKLIFEDTFHQKETAWQIKASDYHFEIDKTEALVRVDAVIYSESDKFILRDFTITQVNDEKVVE
jgi:hypothetical protein